MARYLSKTSKISCRVVLLRNNYKVHLKSKHTRENCNDLRPANQTTLSSLFTQGISGGTVTGKRRVENEVGSHNSAISRSVVFGEEASAKMMRGQNKDDTDMSHANASVFAQQEQQQVRTSVEKNLNTTKAVIQRRENVNMVMQGTAETKTVENKLDEILNVVTDIKKEMKNLREHSEHNKDKNDKKALLVKN